MTTGHSAAAGSSDLTQEAVDALLAQAGAAWRDVTVLASTGSTNADLMQRWLAGAATEGAVIAAGEQVSGRGRLGRSWESPAGSTLSFSILVTPPMQRAGFLPVVTAVTVAEAVAGLTGLDVSLKWPNDVMIAGRKLAGILAEGAGGAAVVGVGINVSMTAAELPLATATSLGLHGADVDRAELLVACLGRFHDTYQRWREAGFDAHASGILAAYRAACGTIGQQVRVSLPDGTSLTGRAVAIDETGRLAVATESSTSLLTAGDVVHVRPG